MSSVLSRFGIVASLLYATPALADAFEEEYPDFACDVDRGPLSEQERQRYGSVDGITQLGQGQNGQENIDRLYARLTAGPIPSGFYNGSIIPATNPNAG